VLRRPDYDPPSTRVSNRDIARRSLREARHESCASRRRSGSARQVRCAPSKTRPPKSAPSWPGRRNGSCPSPRTAVNTRGCCQSHGVGSLKSCQTMKEAYAVRPTVPPSAAIKASGTTGIRASDGVRSCFPRCGDSDPRGLGVAPRELGGPRGVVTKCFCGRVRRRRDGVMRLSGFLRSGWLAREGVRLALGARRRS
jgi:hypothetical protein